MASAVPPITIETVVAQHQSLFAVDKLIKTVGYSAGFLAEILVRRRGATHQSVIGLNQIAAKCSETRYALRFHGSMGVLAEVDAISRHKLGEWNDQSLKTIDVVKSLTLIQYYAFENIAFLGWVAPGWIGRWLEKYSVHPDEWGRYSAFGWVACCLLDLVSCFKKLSELKALESKVTRRSNPEQHSEALHSIGKCRLGLQLQIARDVSWLVPGAQYCLKPGSKWAVVPNYALQGFNLVECLVGYYTMWTASFGQRPTRELKEL